ncbi:uncharacterized protein LOC144601891 [Rhinoraja longicauda]
MTETVVSGFFIQASQPHPLNHSLSTLFIISLLLRCRAVVVPLLLQLCCFLNAWTMVISNLQRNSCSVWRSSNGFCGPNCTIGKHAGLSAWLRIYNRRWSVLMYDVILLVYSMICLDAKQRYVHYISGCQRCMARGKFPCDNCLQTGRVKCRMCDGKGSSFGNDSRCNHCMGNGIESCRSCSGYGQQKCNVCGGKCQLFFYIQLTVKWENNKFEQIIDQQCDFPIQKLNKVTGKELFSDQHFQVYPIVGFPEPRINQVSQQGLQEHWTQFGKTSRIIQQRHAVELIPVTKVHFQWKNEEHSYFVFGTENKVHAPEYPGKKCTIM